MKIGVFDFEADNRKERKAQGCIADLAEVRFGYFPLSGFENNYNKFDALVLIVEKVDSTIINAIRDHYKGQVLLCGQKSYIISYNFKEKETVHHVPSFNSEQFYEFVESVRLQHTN